MRIISTLFYLFISCYCVGQTTDTTEVVVISNCWGRHGKTDTTISLTNKLTGKVSGLNLQSVATGAQNRGCAAATKFPPGNNPLLVIDWVPQKLSGLSEINPNDIQKIEILKPAAATAIFGSEGVNGAILVTMKLQYAKIIIKDFFDKNPVSKATVSFVFPERKDTLRYVADDSGHVVTNSPRKLAGCEMIVSAVGYKNDHRIITNNGIDSIQEIFLSRDVKTCDGVIISTIVCYRKIICRMGVRIIREKVTQSPDPVTGFIIYPNPVRKGGLLNLLFNNENPERINVRVISMDGKTTFLRSVQIVKGNNNIRVSTDSRWAAGVYFVQLVYENGRVGASEQIIIQ